MSMMTEREKKETNKLGVIIAVLVSGQGDMKYLLSAIKYHLVCAAIDASKTVIGLTTELDVIHATLTRLSLNEALLQDPTEKEIKNLWLLYTVFKYYFPNVSEDEFKNCLEVAKVTAL